MSKISIIVPIYNSEKFISRCINSILSQTYENFEIILVNDGSTDNTFNIIKEYCDKRIRIFNQKNKGTGAARNLGLNYATGDYISFVDSDDFIDRDYLKIMLKLSKDNDADIVACVYKKNNKNVKSKILNKNEAFRYLISLPEKIPMSVAGKLFKKELLEMTKFDEDNKYEDIEYATKTFLKSEKVVFINEELYKCCDRNNSRSKFYENDDRIKACYKSIKLIEEKYLFFLNDYITYSLFNSIAIANMMILNNKYNEELLDEVRKVVKEKIKYVRNSQYSYMKKLQIYLFYYNFDLYKKIYKVKKKEKESLIG